MAEEEADSQLSKVIIIFKYLQVRPLPQTLPLTLSPPWVK